MIRDTKRDAVLVDILRHPRTRSSIRDIARRTGTSPTWVSRTVDDLEEEGIVVVEEEPTTRKVRPADTDRVRRLRQVVNLHLLHESGLVDHLVDAYGHPEAIVLFGSFARGEDVEGSDVDLAVLTPSSATVDVGRFGDHLQRSIRIQEIDPRQLTPEFATTLANGIVLDGYLEVSG